MKNKKREDEEEIFNVSFQRVKGEIYRGLSVLQTEYTDFEELLNYRFHRVLTLQGHLKQAQARRLLRTVQSMKPYMKDTRFSGDEPN